MKRGGETLSAQGFTIVETLIVLAVTGTLFVSAALLINGKQSKTNFQVGVRTLQQQFQKVINETASGYYPNNGDFTCAVAGPPLKITAGSNGQGTNQDCIFVGKTLVVGGSTHTDNYGVYPLAGRRVTSGGDDVKTPQEAFITAVAKSTDNSSAPSVKNTPIPNNFTYSKARRTESAVWTPGMFPVAFLSSLGNFQTNATDTGGSQQLNLATYSSWDPAKSDSDNINIEATRTSPYPFANSGVEYCFNSGSTNQSVIIAISAALNVTTSIKSGVDCP